MKNRIKKIHGELQKEQFLSDVFVNKPMTYKNLKALFKKYSLACHPDKVEKKHEVAKKIFIDLIFEREYLDGLRKNQRNNNESNPDLFNNADNNIINKERKILLEHIKTQRDNIISFKNLLGRMKKDAVADNRMRYIKEIEEYIYNDILYNLGQKLSKKYDSELKCYILNGYENLDKLSKNYEYYAYKSVPILIKS